ncbi:hypothetical protein LCGC14_1757850 [marine sediment metagenome]|uniref:Uncharacterized protein n=1 Tax=marine sediment metagenome TaxID=412755 RepID=A0A0F9HP80_9ZZZZ|nr:hypothetical protein [Candidatus Aminicenantes bacterium]
MGYKEDLQIDDYALDSEWDRQAALYMKWAEEYADAVLIRDRAKENVDLVRAELYQQIVSKADKKPTESAIGNEIIQHDKYKEANNNYLEAKKNAEILAGAKEAMQHKKKALEGRTHLWIAGYNAEPKIPAEAKKNSFEKTDKEIKLSRKDRPDRLKRRKIEK